MSKTLLMVAFECPNGYGKIDEGHQDKPDELIYHALSLNVQKQLSFKGRYISAMATPDRW